MSMQLQDGSGKGYLAKVFSDLRIAVRAAISSALAVNSDEEGQAYSWTNATYDPDAADTILLVKNTGTQKLHVTKIIIYCDTLTVAQIQRPTTTVATPTGTAVTGVNLNGSSANAAAATAKADETTNVQGEIIASPIVPAGIPVQIDLDGAVILTTNQSIGVDFVTAATAGIVSIFGYFDD